VRLWQRARGRCRERRRRDAAQRWISTETSGNGSMPMGTSLESADRISIEIRRTWDRSTAGICRSPRDENVKRNRSEEAQPGQLMTARKMRSPRGESCSSGTGCEEAQPAN